jgi:aminopeptidase N
MESKTSAPSVERKDLHSFANLEDIRVNDVALDISVNFAERKIEGAVVLGIDRISPEARELVLDTRALDIHEVEAARARPRRPAPSTP